jgi:DNA helicase HerA-like ATPase
MYLPDQGTIWLATGTERVCLEPSMANRHGLIAGATGTGKTVTLKVIAESFSELGVPVFIADIKGDVSGMCEPGEENKHIRRSIDTMGIENFDYTAYPVRFFDVYGERGLPVRTTVSEMGPVLLARLLGLNETQSGILRLVFRIADDEGLLLLDLKDLRSILQYAGEHARDYKLRYGNITPQSLGAIQRALLALEDEGGDVFFGEPALDLSDWFDWDAEGRGVMNILECQTLFQHPLLYGTFLLWMLSELYEYLPEAGDLDKPKMAFFFDEAHLLFKDAPKALLEKIEQVVV